MSIVIESRDLVYVGGNSNKEYHIQLLSENGSYLVNAQWGRRGNTLQTQTKVIGVSGEAAKKLYDKVVGEKVGKGYKDEGEIITLGKIITKINQAGKGDYVTPQSFPAVETVTQTVQTGKRKIRWQDDDEEVVLIPQLLNVIEESEVEKFLKDDSYGMQEKKNGKHIMIRFKDGSVKVSNKKGKEVGFPSCWETSLKTYNVAPDVSCILDGEGIGEVFHAFDLLDLMGKDYRNDPYIKRWGKLDSLALGPSIKVVTLAVGYKAKKALYDKLVAEKKEGVVFKKLESTHKPGKAHSDMWKFKFVSTASVKVIKGRKGKRSIGMEILNGDKWEFIGYCTVPSNKKIPLSGVAEIRYLYAHKGGSLYQPFYIGLRDDVDENECVIKQLKYKAEED